MINPFIYFLLFLKASLFSTGGFSNLPSLHQDLIANGWAKEADFGQSIAIGQISPGPNGLWVISLGYLTYGYLGAFLALIAITRSEEHTSELQSPCNIVCRLLLEEKNYM